MFSGALEAQRVIEFHRQVRVDGMEAVVTVGVAEPVVQYHESLLSRLGNPVQPAVDTHRFRDVVILQEMVPDQAWREGDPHPTRCELGIEVAPRKLDVVLRGREPKGEVLEVPWRSTPCEEVPGAVYSSLSSLGKDLKVNPSSTAGGSPHCGKVIAAFLAIYTIWGSTYLGIRIAVETLPPFLMAGLRFMISGLLLYGWSRWRGAARPTRQQWTATAVIGAFLLLGGNGAVVGVAHLLPSGLSALLVATIPFWMVGLDWTWRGGTRPTARVLFGLAVGFVGLGLLIGPGSLTGGGTGSLVGAAILLLGTFSWAVGSVYSRSATLPSSPLLTVGMEQIAGGLLLLLLGVVAGEPSRFDPSAVSARSALAFLYLMIFGSLIGFSSYIWLLSVSTMARVSTYAYVNPVIAVFLGWSLGGETVTARTLVAAAIIVSSVALITIGSGTRKEGRGQQAGKTDTERRRKRAVATDPCAPCVR